MNPLDVNFHELYRRHLCRHSQWGINILHLLAVAGIYMSLCGIALALPASEWIVGGILLIWFGVLAKNIEPRLLIANALFVAALLGIMLSVPRIGVWVYVVLVIAWHRFQIWNHRIFDREYDMTEFSEKYRKGPALSFVLAVYELPILLNYLMFDRRGES